MIQDPAAIERFYLLTQGVDPMKPKHMLKNLIPEGSQFPTRVPGLITELAKQIGLPPDHIDYSMDGLAQVEELVRNQFEPRQRTKRNLFLPLVAYVSEVARQTINGQWEMRLASDAKTWEPWIVDANGNEYEFFTATYKEFCDLDDATASIVGAISGRLRAYVFNDFIEKSDPSDWPEKEDRKKDGQN
jgi:hypothetical protein